MDNNKPSNIETVSRNPLMQINMDLLADKFDRVTDAIYDKMMWYDCDSLEKFRIKVNLDDVIVNHDPSKCPHLDEDGYAVLGRMVDMFLDNQCEVDDLLYDKNPYSFSRYIVTELSAPNVDNKIYSLHKEYNLINVRINWDE